MIADRPGHDSQLSQLAAPQVPHLLGGNEPCAGGPAIRTAGRAIGTAPAGIEAIGGNPGSRKATFTWEPPRWWHPALSLLIRYAFQLWLLPCPYFYPLRNPPKAPPLPNALNSWK